MEGPCRKEEGGGRKGGAGGCIDESQQKIHMIIAGRG